MVLSLEEMEKRLIQLEEEVAQLRRRVEGYRGKPRPSEAVVPKRARWTRTQSGPASVKSWGFQ
jgi:hypothetical protein